MLNACGQKLPPNTWSKPPQIQNSSHFVYVLNPEARPLRGSDQVQMQSGGIPRALRVQDDRVPKCCKTWEKIACDEKVDSKDLGICEIHIHFCLHKSTNCPIYYLMGFLGPQEGICASRLYACIDGTSWYLSGGWLVGHTTGCAAAVKHMHGGPVTFSHHESFAVAQQSFGTTTVTASKEGN